MGVTIARGDRRFADRDRGRLTRHAFSFGSHYDPDRVGFGPMVCHDDHLLAEGRGFDTHRHQGVEIISWVLSGAVTHTDSTGTSATLHAGDVGLFSTGDGVEHTEVAAAPQTRFVQVWLGTGPSAEVGYHAASPDLAHSVWTEVARPLPGAAFAVARLDGGEALTVPPAPRRHLFVASGALLRSSLAEPLQAGDAYLVDGVAGEDEPYAADFTVTAAVPTELLLWSFT